MAVASQASLTQGFPIGYWPYDILKYMYIHVSRIMYTYLLNHVTWAWTAANMTSHSHTSHIDAMLTGRARRV